MGAVCERGVVLLDPDRVRVLDTSGRVVSTWPLPRAGDTITASERADIVESM
jgi:hypothetical protein